MFRHPKWRCKCEFLAKKNPFSVVSRNSIRHCARKFYNGTIGKFLAQLMRPEISASFYQKLASRTPKAVISPIKRSFHNFCYSPENEEREREREVIFLLLLIYRRLTTKICTSKPGKLKTCILHPKSSQNWEQTEILSLFLIKSTNIYLTSARMQDARIWAEKLSR